jgi:ribosomal protein S6--L-glutamate ligase
VRLLILSRSASVPSTRRLVAVARERGHRVRVLNPTRVEMLLETGRGHLYAKHRRIPYPDAVIPRIAPSVASYGLAVVEQLEASGTVALNGAQAVGVSRNLLRVLQRLSASGIAVPATVMAHEAAHLKAMLSMVGGVPVLVKLLQGNERKSTMVCETVASLEAALDAVLGLGHNLVVQQYVRGAKEVRALVVGGRVVAAMERLRSKTSKKKDKAGRYQPWALSPAQEAAIERAARTLQLEVCSVDVLVSRDETRVFEVDALPQLPEFERVTQVDAAAAIVARAEALVEAASKKTANSGRGKS